MAGVPDVVIERAKALAEELTALPGVGRKTANLGYSSISRRTISFTCLHR